MAIREARASRFVALWLVLFAALVVWKFGFFFSEEHWEVGDYAANGLQIRQAKDFREIHGNYSRFGFHHPGPGFFYAYALGEALFYDWLKIVPSPHNAHVLVGVLLQTGFLTWTLAILARRFRYPMLVPLILIFAALHFGAVNYNIAHSMYESIWPPHVLLFPFLCFLVACASIAAGSAKEVLPAITAGCLLVHGHVAQPLFVGPMFVASCIAFAFRLRSTGTSLATLLRHARWPLAVATFVLVVFVMPLAIDASHGEKSNLAQIVQQKADSAGDRKTILQSLNYLGNFACYVPDPEKFCDELDAESLIYARDRWYVATGWLLLLGALVLAFRRRSSDQSFYRALHLFLAIGILLMIWWGVMQAGPMLAFNAHFAFALLFVPMILLAIAISGRVGETAGRRIAPFATVLAVPLIVLSSYDRNFWPPVGPGDPYEELKPHAKAEVHRKKFLRFPHHEWPWAVGAALALRRIGLDFRVDPHWRFIFGDRKTGRLASILRSNEMQIWDIGADPAKRGGFQLHGGPYVRTVPPQLDPASGEIRFDGDAPSAAEFAATGWDVTGGTHSFSTARTAALYFRPLQATRDVEMIIDCFPATFAGHPSQRMVVAVGRERLREMAASSDIVATVIIPAALWNGGDTITILFDFPDSVAPRDLGMSADTRRLGFGFRSIRFRESPSP